MASANEVRAYFERRRALGLPRSRSALVREFGLSWSSAARAFQQWQKENDELTPYAKPYGNEDK